MMCKWKREMWSITAEEKLSSQKISRWGKWRKRKADLHIYLPTQVSQMTEGTSTPAAVFQKKWTKITSISFNSQAHIQFHVWVNAFQHIVLFYPSDRSRIGRVSPQMICAAWFSLVCVGAPSVFIRAFSQNWSKQKIKSCSWFQKDVQILKYHLRLERVVPSLLFHCF